jgi:dTDP-4-dehydrorhamnose 3,5-epimerase
VKVQPTSLPEVLLIEPRVFGDARGFFLETFSADRYRDAGIASPFVQDNLSLSRRGVLRGLHFQQPNAQGKLVQVLAGEVFDIAVDIRLGSPTFRQWVGVHLSSANKHQLYIPPGFAHGFLVMSEEALFHYKCTVPYDAASERSIRWNDPKLAIEWPMHDVVLSDRDAVAPLLGEMPEAHLPTYGASAAVPSPGKRATK